MSGIRAIQTGEHALVGDIIADSFADDPVNLWIFRNALGMKGFYSLAARKLYLKKGYGHVADDDGCALWLPPGVRKHIPLWNSLDIAASMIRHSGAGSIRRGSEVDGGLEARHPTQPHHYLFAIGTRPAKQGKGIGGMLMAAGLKIADADNLPAYLESSKESNVSFYRRFGFEVIEKLVPAADAPPLWLMWREARAQGS
jgi:ribosomal protein S18 acetylase RimI-like enzyme